MGPVKAGEQPIERRGGGILAAGLLIAAMPFARPNIFGERYATVAAALTGLAAFVAFAQDHGRPALGHARWRPLRSTVLWLFLAHLWVAYVISASAAFTASLQSFVVTVFPVAAAALVLAHERRRMIAAKLLALVVLALSASYAVTLAVWLLQGVGTGVVGNTFIGASELHQPVFFPFTVTLGDVHALGMDLPRLTGIGREPGWMAMYAGFVFFLLPRIGWGKWRPLALVGLVATASTAGFGVFAIVATFELFLRRRQASSLLADYLRRLTGLAVMAVALWVAVYAPVLGLEAKGARDQYSVHDRQAATEAGWAALQTNPWGTGGSATQVVGGVNLVAAIAAVGLPFVLCVLAALLMPRRTHWARHLSSAPVAILVLTLATSQPPRDSTWVFVCALIAYAVTQPLESDAGAGGVTPSGAVAEPGLRQGRVVVAPTDARE